MKTVRILGHEIELSPSGLIKIMELIDNAGKNDAKQIGYNLVGILMEVLPKEKKPEPTGDGSNRNN